MSWLPLSFGFPAVLAGLLALPVIWWLLRLTPPKPQTETFPPLKILARVLKREETPHQSPWWLTLLRLLMAALVIFALAEPVFNPRERLETSGGPLALVVDNGWASAQDWELRVATAERLIADAQQANQPVVLAFTAEPAAVDIGPFDAATASQRLAAAVARPVPVDRSAVYARVAAALEGRTNVTAALLTDGLSAETDEAAFKSLLDGNGVTNLVWATGERLPGAALTGVENSATAFTVSAVRPQGSVGPLQLTAGAFDDRGRRIADVAIAFGPGETAASADVAVPFELRNDFSSIALDGQPHAGAIRVMDDSSRRRRVGLLSQAEADQAQPLLSPLYYIRRALQPFADLVEPQTPDLAIAVPELLAQKPAMIVMADVGNMPDAARKALVEWVESGGTLVRFAGPRLAAASAEGEDPLLPVPLRAGERALGGALSWTEPQPVSDYPPTGPFAGLTPPQDVAVSRQVLAEPTPDLADRTWANLADGTPLVTGRQMGRGTIALFHVTPEATWSNLPISGSFVEMLRRIAQLSRNQGTIDGQAGAAAPSLPPYRLIASDGVLTTPGPEAQPLKAGAATKLTIENPPGLYGSEDGVLALNLLPQDATLAPVTRPQTSLSTTNVAYALDESRPLKGPLFAAALALMALDTLAVFWLGGVFARRRAGIARSAATALVALALLFSAGPDALAQIDDSRPGDADAIAAISQTRIAYVLTGDSSIDSVSRAGLEGLRQFLIEKTALEPGEPAGVDIAKDELSFYPIIYWPIDAAAAMPDEAAIARVDAYMQAGGTVLFDTRDEFDAGFSGGASSAANGRLRDILGRLNVPALEPVPDDHVLTKSFFIMKDFPGRFAGSPLWVAASTPDQAGEDRPVRQGDGVSPIMITGNDLAGAWAMDSSGQPLYPTVPNDPMQRVYALRGGVNIMMYMLTGNYKSDQVHVPILLERLGQ
jgi:hypothetical protein